MSRDESFIKLNKDSYQYTKSVQRLFDQICKPLKELSIDFFSYMRIFKNGQYLLISNNPDLNYLYLGTIKSAGEFWTHKISNDNMSTTNEEKSNFFIYSPIINNFDKNKDPVVHLTYDLGIKRGISTYKSEDDYSIENYAFCTREVTDPSLELYLNNYQLLDRFIRYFKDKSQDMIDTSDKRKLAYYNHDFDLHNRSYQQKTEMKVRKFLEMTRCRYTSISTKKGNVIPTIRELECINYMLKGYSMKQVANILDLSPRTVEAYIQNIKQKTGCTSKSDLLSAFANSNFMGRNA